MLRKKLLALVASTALFGGSVQADTGTRADAHAPIGVMGDHTHGAGEFMLSYRYMFMDMDTNLSGSTTLANQDIVAASGFGYRVVPKDMRMHMMMLGAMYGITDTLTVALMVNFIQSDMDHLTRSNMSFETSSSGISDTKLSALYQLSTKENTSLVANFTVSAPSGDIDAKDVTPMSNGNEVQLPYPMQLGSGTVDLTAGFTFNYWLDDWSWGSQALYTHRLDENDNGYTLGDRHEVTAWIARKASDHLSVSTRIQYEKWLDINGADPLLNPALVPTADPALRSGESATLFLGMNTLFLSSHRIALELGFPFHQHLKGPQLSNNLELTLGYQLAF